MIAGQHVIEDAEPSSYGATVTAVSA